MASTPSPSQALTKRQAEQQLMPPPPPPKRIKRPSTVLDEDIYTNALSEIIARDFFPGLLESQVKQEYLEALESKDQVWIASSRKKLAEFVEGAGDGGGRRTPSQMRATSRFAGDETPTGWGGDTPMSVVSTSTAGTATPSSATTTTTTQPPKEIPDVSNIGLMAFQSKYTSEDNESFNKLMDRQNAKHREKYAWVWSGNKIPTARQIAHHTREVKRITAQGEKPAAAADNADEKNKAALIKSDLDSRPAKPDAWDAKPENSLMFLPSSIEDTHETIQQRVEAASRAGPKRVLYQNTRLGSSDGGNQQQPPPPSPAISAIQDAIAGRPRLTGSEASVGSYTGGETPRVNGYAFVDEDELEPSSSSSSSFDQHGDDDTHLLGSADKTPNPFQIPQNRKREDLHHRMVDRMARTKRAEKANVETKTPVIPRFASSPRVDFGRTPSSVTTTPGGAGAGKALTPAAQKLLKRVGNSTPRGSSGASPSQLRSMWTPTPKRK